MESSLGAQSPEVGSTMSGAWAAIDLQLSRNGTWSALTDRSSLASWLGDLEGDLTVVGAACEIQIDEVDRYSVLVVEVEPRLRLTTMWSRPWRCQEHCGDLVDSTPSGRFDAPRCDGGGRSRAVG